MRMGRSEVALKKGPWTAEEDEKLVEFIRRKGHGSWRALPREAGLNRCGKSCRLRWTNYLRPDIKRGNFSPEEEKLIVDLHGVLGNKWSTIAGHLPGRTDNEIKNLWNTHLKKKLLHMGIDPLTHRPVSNMNILFSSLPHFIAAANLATALLANSNNDLLFSDQIHSNNMYLPSSSSTPNFIMDNNTMSQPSTHDYLLGITHDPTFPSITHPHQLPDQQSTHDSPSYWNHIIDLASSPTSLSDIIHYTT